MRTMMPMVHRIEILRRKPATRRPDSLLVGVTISGSVLEDVFGFGPCLLGVSLGLLDASLGAQPGVAGGAAEVLLGGALNGFGLMGELLADAHVGFLRVVAIANRPRPGIDRSSVLPPNRVRCYRVVSRRRHCSALRRFRDHGDGPKQRIH